MSGVFRGRTSRRRALGGAAVCALALLAVPGCSADDDGRKDRAGGTTAADRRDGNGVEDLSAREISDRAKQELLDAKSVHIAVRETGADATRDASPDADPSPDSDADIEADDPTSMDLTLDRDGNCVGSMKMAGGASLELVKRGDKVWMKPDEQFWTTQIPGGEGEAAAEIFKNRWVHGTTGDAMLKDIAGVCDLGEIQRDIADDADDSDDSDDDGKTLKKGEPTTQDGMPVIPLTGTDDGKETTLYVATEGKPYLVKAVEKGDGDDTTTTFSAYDEPVPTKTPSADESVDVSKLQEQLQKT
ncbi:hypothetical protein [Streptomyces sp. NPDC002564]|uniref:hypothetical protein n=1 Tax=Streptomyces sp. NPDC002564 TaxID=3364649 RepID=UPI0036C099BC